MVTMASIAGERSSNFSAIFFINTETMADAKVMETEAIWRALIASVAYN